MAASNLNFVPEYPGFADGQALPPKSRLFALEPIGIGKPTAESMISYVVRLASAYSVSPRRLIREEFAKFSPEIAKQYRRFPNKNAVFINGLGRYSDLFADIIEKLCRQPCTRDLTLQPLKSLLPFNGVGLNFSNPRWCPACYTRMRESRKELYLPLAWSFDLYQVCPRHEKTLIDRCPACNSFQDMLPRSPIIGHCSYCGACLGEQPASPQPAQPFELWMASAIEEIIAELPRLGKLATRERFLGQLKEAINHFTDGSRREFCRQIGLPDAAFQIWIQRGGRPSLARWLAVSYGIDINPVKFLEVDFGSFSSTTVLRKLPCALKPQVKSPSLTATQRQAIQSELDAIAEAGHGDISVTMLAHRHQLARRHLQALWPDLCQKISFDFRETTRRRWEEEVARKRNATMRTVDALLEGGIYPCQRIVRDALNRIGISFANPAVRDAYKQQLKTRLGENEVR